MISIKINVPTEQHLGCHFEGFVSLWWLGIANVCLKELKGGEIG